MLGGAPPLRRAVEIRLQRGHGLLQLHHQLGLGIGRGSRAMSVGRELGQAVGLLALQREALLRQGEADASRCDPQVKIMPERLGIIFCQHLAGLDDALAQRDQLLQGLATLLGALEVGLGARQARAVGERILDGGDHAIRANAVAGIERMPPDVAHDRRGRGIDPAGDRGISQDDRAQIGPAHPADIRQKADKGD